jgi:hypothetical protein
MGGSLRSPDRHSKAQPGGPSILPAIRRDLCDRLAELDSERALILRVLATLDRKRSGRVRLPAKREAILHAVSQEPGVRASMLGLTLGIPTDQVAHFLTDLEQAGLVGRSGLGWRVTGT